MKYVFNFILVLFSCLTFIEGSAQHQHESTSAPSSHKMNGDTMMPPMSHAFSMSLPMNRNGSGTGWLPDSTPMYGYMLHAKKWMMMFHGNVFLRYNKQDLFESGSRGAEKADAVSWFMCMGQRRIGNRGLFRFSTMLSADPLFGGNGYPLLFQTGEAWQGKPLVDRQHPHDLVSELSVAYTYSVNKNTDAFVYAGYPGEPALGSVAFMHRVSALYNPDAPLTHHWNDGTHITFGVLTAGLRIAKFKFDGSVYKGREPDENRYDFDKALFDSYSGRISYNPNAFWSFQVSEGYNKSPEELHPLENVYRSTASAVYSKPLRAGHFLNATALLGTNRGHTKEHAVLLEAALVMKRWSTYGRYEWVEKSAEELDLNENNFGENSLFYVHAISAGVSYDLMKTKFFSMALGMQGSFFMADQRLDNLYGKHPASAELYLRLYPPRMFMRKM